MSFSISILIAALYFAAFGIGFLLGAKIDHGTKIGKLIVDETDGDDPQLYVATSQFKLKDIEKRKHAVLDVEVVSNRHKNTDSNGNK